jgi:hypothetical protein
MSQLKCIINHFQLHNHFSNELLREKKYELYIEIFDNHYVIVTSGNNYYYYF